MSDTPETNDVLPPEHFAGEIIVEERHIPIDLTASADQSGRLVLVVEPISISGSSSGLLELTRSSGRPGLTVDEFRLECESSDGKRLTSDRAYLTGSNHSPDGFRIQLRTMEANLRMTARETHDHPSLSFWLLGFECFPQVSATMELGTVVARGATRTTATDEITGMIALQASDDNTSIKWRQQAEHLLKHLRTVLAFARGARLPVPLTQFYERENCEVTFYEVGGGYLSQMPPQPHLNLGPIFSTAAQHVDIVEEYRDAFETVIGWLLVPTTYDEVRFLTLMTALESFASRSLARSETNILGSSPFDRFARKVRSFIDEQDQLDECVREAIKEKVPELNRRTFNYKITALFRQWNIARTLIDDDVLAGLVGLRNRVVHQGGAPEDEDIWPSILILREILVRLVFAMLRFEGNYECYVDGRHMRQFPSCEPVD